MKKNDINFYKKYCTGCGLCSSLNKATLQLNPRGFWEPKPTNDTEFVKFCNKLCPASGVHSSDLSQSDIWGKVVENGVYYGYSSDEAIRHSASSGGVITSLAIYLLESRKVDGIIQVGIKENSPIETDVFCSTTREEVISCCGSRYITSSPLVDIEKYLSSNKRYAFIGKPCDIAVLRNLAKQDERVDKTIIYMLSFFCAGTPSFNVQEKLLNNMGLNIDECKSLKYRGDGWPGQATAIDINGNKHSMSYEESWGKILGRDVCQMCRFCIDGIGELADISCGDAWYLTEDNRPDFTESEGRNVVFARSESGKKLVDDAVTSSYLKVEPFINYERELISIQKYQFERRAYLKCSESVTRIMGKKCPKYDKKLLRFYSSKVSFKLKIRRSLGVLKRVLKGSI